MPAMKRYEKYKDSGVEWIGEVPEHWDVSKLKYLVSTKLMYGANEVAEDENPSDPRYIRITDFGDNGKLRDDTFKSLSFEKAKNYLLREGDILFARSGATVGKTFQFKDYNGVACFAGYLIKVTPDISKIYPNFLYYYTKSETYETWKNSIFNQATIQNIGADKYNFLELPIPFLEEQTAIANYLDEKTAKIDKLIANKQKLIELFKEERTAIINQAVTKGIDPNVKLKPSGIEWLGDIPEHWQVKKLKYITHLKSGDSITSDNIREEDDYPVFGGNGLRGYTSSYTHEGDYVLIGRQGALCGNINYAKGKFWASEHAIVVTRLNGENIICIGELLREMDLNQYSISAAQPGLSVERIQNLSIPYPPQEEQEIIGSYIKVKSEKIDSSFIKIQKEIELLQEFRTALISEVVTGKIKVI